MSRRGRTVAALALAAAALAGPGVGGASAAEDQSYAAALNYATPALVAAQGDTLRFNNLDSLAEHDLVSDTPGQFGTPLIAGGDSAVATGVDKLAPGTYPFHCSIHPWMHGELTVAPGPGGGGSPGPPPPPSGPPSGGPATPNPADLLPHVAAAPLSGGEWPFYGGDLAGTRSGGSSAPSYNEVPTLGPVWSFESTDGDFTGTPVVAGGTLVAAAGGGTVFAFDAATGKLRWKRDLNQTINASAAIAGGRVFVPLATPGHPAVAALSLRDGSLLWKTVVDPQKDADLYGSPVVWRTPGIAPAPARPQRRGHHRRRHHHRARRCSRHHRRCHRRHCAHRARSTHHRRRRHHHHRAHRRRHTHRTPQAAPPQRVAADTVFIGTSSLFGEVNDPDVSTRGSVVALDAATGAMRWKTYTVPPGHDGGAVWSTPAIDTGTGRLYVGTGNAYHPPAADTTDSVLALDTRSGQLVGHIQATADDVWNETNGKASGPDYDFGASPNLFTGPDGKKLVGAGQKSGTYWAFERDSLKPVWSAVTGPGSPVVGGIVGSTAVDGGRIFGPNTSSGEVWGIRNDGLPQWVSSDGGTLQYSPIAAGNGVVYSNSTNGTITAREASTGAVLAKLPLGAPSWGGVALAGGSVFAVTGTEGSSGWIVAYRPRG